MNPQLTNALIAAALAFADSLKASSGGQPAAPAPAPTTTKTTKAAPAAKVETPEPVKEPEPEVSFDEPAEITLDSLKAKYRPLVQHADDIKRKSFQAQVGKWMLAHGAKAISEVKAEDYAEFDTLLTELGKGI